MAEQGDGPALTEPADGPALTEPADGPVLTEPADGPALTETADGEHTLTADEEAALLEDEPPTTKQADTLLMDTKPGQSTLESAKEMAKPESELIITEDAELEESADGALTENNPILSDSTEPEKAPFETENTSIMPEMAPIEQEKTPFETGNTSIVPEMTSTEPENTTIEPENTYNEPEKTPIESENTSILSENNHVEPENTIETEKKIAVDSSVEQQLTEDNPMTVELDKESQPEQISDKEGDTEVETINQSEQSQVTETQDIDMTDGDITSTRVAVAKPDVINEKDSQAANMIIEVTKEHEMSENSVVETGNTEQAPLDNEDVEMTESNKIESKPESESIIVAEAEPRNEPIVTMMAEDSLPEEPINTKTQNESETVTDVPKIYVQVKEKDESEIELERTVTMMAENEDAEMSEAEPTVTMLDVLKEQEEFEDNANAVLGASDDKECTFAKGYVKRQALYACLTCCSDSKSDPTKRAGVCLACSLACHENHDLIELYTKRNFRCDCGNPKFKDHPCVLTPDKLELNVENNYDQNFSGLYCICHRPYPDTENPVDDEMIQCIVCEDWLHSAHLEATVPANDQYSEMICKACMEKNDFLNDYTCYAVNVSENQVIDVVNGEDKKNGIGEETSRVNGSSNDGKMDEHTIKMEENTEDLNDTIADKVTNCIEVQRNEEAAIDENKTQGADAEALSDIQEISKISELNENEFSTSEEVKNSEKDSEQVNDKSELEINSLNREERSDKPEQINEESNKGEDIEQEIGQDKQDNDNLKMGIVGITEQAGEIASEDSEMTDLTKVDDKSEEHPTIDPVASSAVSDEEKEQLTIDAVASSAVAIDDEASSAVAIDDEASSAVAIDDEAKEQPTIDPVVCKDDCNTKSTADVEMTEEKETESTDLKDDEDTAHPVTSTNAPANLHIADSDAVSGIDITSNDAALNVNITDSNTASDINTTATDATSDVNTTATDATSDVNTTATDATSDVNTTATDATSDVNTTATNAANEVKTNATNADLGINERKEDFADKKQTASTAEDVTANCESETNKTVCDQVEMKDTGENIADVLATNKENEQGNKVSNATAEPNVEVALPLEETEKVTISTFCEGKKVSQTENGTDVTTIHQNGYAAGHGSNENNKRKLSTEEIEGELSVKKSKINESQCKRPKVAARKYKGATFWPCSWRQKLCSCHNCVAMYRDNAVLFLLDLEDTVSAYEDLGKAKNEGESSQYEKGLQALSSLDRIQQINALTEYNRMKDKLLDFLKSFKDNQEVVKEEDIKEFFADMKPRREPDGGVYFCR